MLFQKCSVPVRNVGGLVSGVAQSSRKAAGAGGDKHEATRTVDCIVKQASFSGGLNVTQTSRLSVSGCSQSLEVRLWPSSGLQENFHALQRGRVL